MQSTSLARHVRSTAMESMRNMAKSIQPMLDSYNNKDYKALMTEMLPMIQEMAEEYAPNMYQKMVPYFTMAKAYMES